ncbi:MAG: enoyl-CoA hydratase/isomerase family protein, partial [Chitinophagaceae bacterium]
GLFSYISHRIPEISDEVYRIDDAMKAGFGWEIGAFESWDVLGVEKTVAAMKAAGYSVASWVEEMLAAGNKSFYKVEGGKTLVYDPASKSYKQLPGSNDFIILSNYKDKTVWKNGSCKVYDIGDDVLGLQWNTKMNSIGGDVLSGINKAIELAEKDYKGLVIANDGANFSAGANVGMIFMIAIEQEWDELDMAIRMFQNTMMRARYSSVPVVTAHHGLSLGGACELSLHSDKVCAAAETFDLGIYRKGLDEVVMNLDRRVMEAKKSVIEIYDSGYVTPTQRKDIKALGRGALGALYSGIHGMQTANYATEHDAKVARKLAYVMCGGDLSEATYVSEQYLLDLEREAFLSL